MTHEAGGYYMAREKFREIVAGLYRNLAPYSSSWSPACSVSATHPGVLIAIISVGIRPLP
jgi:hypothetical protein